MVYATDTSGGVLRQVLFLSMKSLVVVLKVVLGKATTAVVVMMKLQPPMSADLQQVRLPLVLPLLGPRHTI